MFATAFFAQVPIATLGGNFYSVDTTESSTFSDTDTVAYVDWAGNTSESSSLTDTLTSQAIFTPTVAEIATYGDNYSANAAFAGILVDTFTALDIPTATTNFYIALDEFFNSYDGNIVSGWEIIHNVPNNVVVESGMQFGGGPFGALLFSGGIVEPAPALVWNQVINSQFTTWNTIISEQTATRAVDAGFSSSPYTQQPYSGLSGGVSTGPNWTNISNTQ